MAHIPELPEDLFREEPPSRPQKPKVQARPRGRPRRAGRRPRRGGQVPLWAWVLVGMGWLLACAVTGVAGWWIWQTSRSPISGAVPPAPTEWPTPSPFPVPAMPSPTATFTVPLTVLPSPTPTALPPAGEEPTNQVQLPPTEAVLATLTFTPTAAASATPTLSITPTPGSEPLPSPTMTVSSTPGSEPLPSPTMTVSSTPASEPSPTPTLPSPQTPLTLLIPLYIYPSPQNLPLWEKVAQARQQVAIIAIINPNNGPGGPPNEDYRRAMNLLKQAGVVLLGYVPTGYGNRSSEAIRSDVSLYDTYFPVDGIFFDEVPTDPRYVNKYRALYTYAKAFFPNGLVAFNPGTVPDAAYLDFGDIWVMFENIPSAFVPFSPPEGYGEQTAVLVHTAAVGEMRNLLDRIKRQGLAAYVYFTDDREPNPWDSLPSYWEEEVQEVAR